MTLLWSSFTSPTQSLFWFCLVHIFFIMLFQCKFTFVTVEKDLMTASGVFTLLLFFNKIDCIILEKKVKPIKTFILEWRLLVDSSLSFQLWPFQMDHLWGLILFFGELSLECRYSTLWSSNLLCFKLTQTLRKFWHGWILLVWVRKPWKKK